MFSCIDVLVTDSTTLYFEDVIKLFKMYPNTMRKSQEFDGDVAGAMKSHSWNPRWGRI